MYAFQVGTLRWQQDDFGIGVLIEKVTPGDEARVTIHDQVTGVLQEPVFTVSQVTAHLFHPRGIGTRCDACNVDTACLQMHDCEHIERDQSVPCPHFDRREIRDEDGIPVGFQERRPYWCSLSVGCWLNAVCLQYVPHPGIRDVVFQILQYTLNPIVSPCWILPGEANDGTHDDLLDAWPTGLPFVAGIKLLRDEFPVPSQDRVWREDGCEFPQSLAADDMSLHRKESTLVIVEQQSLLSELFEQCFDLSVLELDDLLLPMVHEAAEAGEHQMPGLEQERHVRRRRVKSSG